MIRSVATRAGADPGRRPGGQPGAGADPEPAPTPPQKPSAGQAAQTPAPAPGPPPVKIKRTEILAVDNWTVTCSETDETPSKRRCTADLKIYQTENGADRLVFTWIMALQDGKPISILTMPSGVQIPPGAQLKAGDKDPRKAAFSICQPDHCEATLLMDEMLIKDLKAAATTEVSVVAANGNAVRFTVNMKGFAAAVADLGK